MKPEGEGDKKLSVGERLEQIRKDLSEFLYSKNDDGIAVVMGRTGPSWGKIGLFFFVYYACLAGFFSAIFAIAFSTMPDIKDGPKYTSFIADRPAHVEQNAACYDSTYCVAGDSYRPADMKKQCRFNMSSLGPCASDEDYGYKEGAPCIYLRLSKIYGWEPKPYSGNFVGLQCNATGDENVKIEYYPPMNKAFPISFWPFRGECYFMLPLAAIKVYSKNTVEVQCKALARNIELSETWKIDKGATGQVEFKVSPARA